MSCSLATELTCADTDLVLGIDVGTTNTCAAVYHNNQLIDIVSINGNPLFPSVVTISLERAGLGGYPLGCEAGEVAAQKAKDDYEVYKRTLFATKRLIGRSAHDPILKDDLKRWSYQVVDDNNGHARIRLPNVHTDISPEHAAAELLKLIRCTAENQFGCPITRAVITVPAYFTSTQRRATQIAAEMIGLKVLKLITEPTAAALNYAILQPGQTQTDGHMLVYDLGGGTFDVSVLEVKQNVYRVLATGGDPHLGGDDLDGALMNHVVDKVIPNLIQVQSDATNPSVVGHHHHHHSLNHTVNIAQMWSTISADADQHGLFNRQLRYAVREFKHQFTNNPKVTFDHTLCGLPIRFTLSRAQFHQLICKPFIDRTLSHVTKALRAANLGLQQITKVLLVGGSTRLPCVKESLAMLFGVKKICDGVDVDLAVSRGAAVQAALLSRNKEQSLTNVVLSDITAWNLGVEVATTEGQLGPGEEELLQRNDEYERCVLPVKNEATREMNASIEICHKLDKALAKGHIFKTTQLSPDDVSRIKQTIGFVKCVEQWLIKQHPYDQHVPKEDYIDRQLAFHFAFGMDQIQLEVKNLP